MNHYDILVIGGDAAGMSAASQARRISASASIGVFDRGEFVSYGACGLPYYIAGEIPDYTNLLAINVDDFIRKRNIMIYTGAEVTRADLAGKMVTVVRNGREEEYTYGSLIIATGAGAVFPPIEDIKGANTFPLRTLRDGITIREFIDKNSPRKAILIGGGFIGLEMAEALRKRNIETVLLEKMESVAISMSPEIRELVRGELLNNGVAVHTGMDITGITRDGGGVTVRTATGDFTADFMIVSTGVRPNTAFLSESGLTFLKNGAIIVDERSRTVIPGVYAAGDCASVRHIITGRDVYMPLGSTANKQGRVAGLQAAGVGHESFRGVAGTQVVKVFDLEIGKTGFNSRDAETEMIPCDSVISTWHSRAGYYPGAADITVTLTVNRETGIVAGGEIAGTDGAALRINTIAAAITAGMHVNDLAYMDLGYAPPFSPVWDPVAATAQRLMKR